METLDQTLTEHIDELIQSHKRQPLLSTVGPLAATSELAARTQGLEKAILELALEVQRLSTAG